MRQPHFYLFERIFLDSDLSHTIYHRWTFMAVLSLPMSYHDCSNTLNDIVIVDDNRCDNPLVLHFDMMSDSWATCFFLYGYRASCAYLRDKYLCLLSYHKIIPPRQILWLLMFNDPIWFKRTVLLGVGLSFQGATEKNYTRKQMLLILWTGSFTLISRRVDKQSQFVQFGAANKHLYNFDLKAEFIEHLCNTTSILGSQWKFHWLKLSEYLPPMRWRSLCWKAMIINEANDPSATTE